eukprot:scaffold2737_cov229-Pinguiococcus_pyrenoidosus.AAC.5
MSSFESGSSSFWALSPPPPLSLSAPSSWMHLTSSVDMIASEHCLYMLSTCDKRKRGRTCADPPNWESTFDNGASAELCVHLPGQVHCLELCLQLLRLADQKTAGKTASELKKHPVLDVVGPELGGVTSEKVTTATRPSGTGIAARTFKLLRSLRPSHRPVCRTCCLSGVWRGE